MADGGTITQRITDLIGSEHTTNAAYSGDLINAAMNEIADVLPIDLLLKYSASPTTVTSASGVSVEGKKVLRVTRIDANGGIERECKVLGRVEFSSSTDSSSIHYSTVFSPVYKIHSDNAASTLVIFPNCDGSGQEGKIFYFPYIADSTDTTSMTAATLNTTYFLPGVLINAIALKASISILNAYISNQIQDEEDVEIHGMLAMQKQGLEKDFMSEITRFVGPAMAKKEQPEAE